MITGSVKQLLDAFIIPLSSFLFLKHIAICIKLRDNAVFFRKLVREYNAGNFILLCMLKVVSFICGLLVLAGMEKSYALTFVFQCKFSSLFQSLDLDPFMQSLEIYCLTHTNLVAGVNLMAFMKQRKNQLKKVGPLQDQHPRSIEILPRTVEIKAHMSI